MSALAVAGIILAALVMWASIVIFAWAVARAADEPIRLAEHDPVNALDGMGDEANAIVFDFRRRGF